MKLILILSCVVALGAIVVGALNFREAKSKQEDIAAVERDIARVTEELKQAEVKRDEVVVKERNATDTRNQAAAAKGEVETELGRVQSKLDRATDELKKVQLDRKEMELALNRQFPDGNYKTADEVRMKVDMLKQQLSDRQSEKEKLDGTLAETTAARSQQDARVGNEQEFQERRDQKVRLNGMEARVIAVNKDWGFIMVDAGRQNGVEATSSLLVKRDNARLAKLQVVNLEENVVVAKVADGETPVVGIRPGDTVVFESPF